MSNHIDTSLSGQSTDENVGNITLPPPSFDSDYSIEKALLNRRSVRRYSTSPLTLKELAQLLWACQGISKVENWQLGNKDMQTNYRTAPSAGALYPLEVYAMVNRVEGMEPGLYHYLPGPGTSVKIQNMTVEVELPILKSGRPHVPSPGRHAWWP